MTLAICVRCGSEKFGALVPCRECGFAPKNLDDIARSMSLSDHHYGHDELQGLGERIKAGNTIEFDQDHIAGYVETFKADPRVLERIQHPERFPPGLLNRIGCVVLPWVIFIVIMFAAIVAIVRFIKTW